MKKNISVTALLLSVILILGACSIKPNEEFEKNEDNMQIETDANESLTDDKAEENIKENSENKKEEINKNQGNDKKEDNKQPESINKQPESINKQPESINKQPSISEVMNVMISQIPADQHTMQELPKELYKDMFGIDVSQFEDVLIYAPMMNVKANEIVLIKVKNESDIPIATKVLEERKKQTYATWEQYLPDQFEIVKQAKIKTNGKYAALIITSYVDKVSGAFMGI